MANFLTQAGINPDKLNLAPLANPRNIGALETYFSQVGNLGLNPETIEAYVQPLVPRFDDQGQLLSDLAPEGHGEAFHQLVASGRILDFIDENVSAKDEPIIYTWNVDNLGGGFDENFLVALGYFIHLRNKKGIDQLIEGAARPKGEAGAGGGLVAWKRGKLGRAQIHIDERGQSIDHGVSQEGLLLNTNSQFTSLSLLYKIYGSKRTFLEIKKIKDENVRREKLRNLADEGRRRFPGLARKRPTSDGRLGTVVETFMGDATIDKPPKGRVKSEAIQVGSIVDAEAGNIAIEDVGFFPNKDFSDMAARNESIKRRVAHATKGQLISSRGKEVIQQASKGFGAEDSISKQSTVSTAAGFGFINNTPREQTVHEVNKVLANRTSSDTQLTEAGIVVVRASQANPENINTLIGFAASSAQKGVLVVQDNGSAGSAFVAAMQQELAKFKAYGVRDRIHFLHLQGTPFNEKIHSLLTNGEQGQGVLGVMAGQLGIKGDIANHVVVISPEAIEGAWTLKLDLNTLTPDIAARRLDVASYLGLEAASLAFNVSGNTLLNQVMDVNAERRQIRVNFEAMGNAELTRLSEQLRAQLSVLIAA